MKKGLIFLLGIMSFLGINTVSADIIISNYYDHFEEHVNAYNTYKENIDYMINYWEENYSDTYPYYYITLNLQQLNYSGGSPDFILMASKNNTFIYDSPAQAFVGNDFQSIIGYYTDVNEYNFDSHWGSNLFYTNRKDSDTFAYNFHHTLTSNGLFYDNSNSDFLISNYTSDELNISIPNIEIKNGSIFPTIIDLYDGSYLSGLTENYVEINLNDYAYVALSLKDYNTIPANNYSYYTNMYVKGQLCSTPVYNYGQTERKEILSGTQVQRCTSYYDDFTLLRKYILRTDVENHAIYYLTGYDSTKENIVKVNSSIYNITYITEENKDNPEVNIGGKIYPTLPYDKLTDSATKSEDEDYISGVVCPVGDLNCYQEFTPENNFDSLFDKPLDMLKSVWGAIISIFDLIGQFIALLPPTMQGFLYLAFGIGVVLGIIKILV